MVMMAADGELQLVLVKMPPIQSSTPYIHSAEAPPLLLLSATSPPYPLKIANILLLSSLFTIASQTISPITVFNVAMYNLYNETP